MTSRNWELIRTAGSRMELPDKLVERGGVAAFVVYNWTIREDWRQRHFLDVGVGVLDGGSVTPHLARLTFWPFRHEELLADLEAAGLAVVVDTYQEPVERYLVTAAPA